MPRARAVTTRWALQTIAGATFNTIFNGTYGNLLVTVPGRRRSRRATSRSQGDLAVTSSTPGTVASSILDIAGSTINRTAAGRDAHGRRRCRTANRRHDERVPGELRTVTLDPTSTVEYYGYRRAVGRGAHLRTPHDERWQHEDGGRRAHRRGTFTNNASTTFAAGASTHEFRGNFTNNGNFSRPRYGPVQRSRSPEHRWYDDPTTFGNVTDRENRGRRRDASGRT